MYYRFTMCGNSITAAGLPPTTNCTGKVGGGNCCFVFSSIIIVFVSGTFVVLLKFVFIDDV